MMEERPNSEFNYHDGFVVTDEVKNAYDVNGYLIIRKLLDPEEHGKLKTALETGVDVIKNTYSRSDGMGKEVDVSIWSHPGNDITGVIARSERMVDMMEKLMEGEVYHYHTKLVMKAPKSGGGFQWHQDYGYWYLNGCLFPDMATAWIAVDKTDKGNGCVEFLVGSHLMGRIDHATSVGQEGRGMRADPKRLEEAKKVFPRIYGELGPGDCAIFHSNTLHYSSPNTSERRRWGMAIIYNRADNDPVYVHHHANYTPLKKVPNSAIKDCDTSTKEEGREYMSPSTVGIRKEAY